MPNTMANSYCLNMFDKSKVVYIQQITSIVNSTVILKHEQLNWFKIYFHVKFVIVYVQYIHGFS